MGLYFFVTTLSYYKGYLSVSLYTTVLLRRWSFALEENKQCKNFCIKRLLIIATPVKPSNPKIKTAENKIRSVIAIIFYLLSLDKVEYVIPFCRLLLNYFNSFFNKKYRSASNNFVLSTRFKIIKR